MRTHLHWVLPCNRCTCSPTPFRHTLVSTPPWSPAPTPLSSLQTKTLGRGVPHLAQKKQVLIELREPPNLASQQPQPAFAQACATSLCLDEPIVPVLLKNLTNSSYASETLLFPS